MTRTLVLAPLLVLLIDHGHCQELAKTPSFDAASVKLCDAGTPGPPGESHGMVQFTFPGGRFEARATTVKYLMEWAYGILPSQHTPGPSWMETDRYDIIAKAKGNASDEQMKLMAQTLLADRFRLKLHRESKDAPVLILSAGKTPPKLFPPKEGEEHGMKMVPRQGGDQKMLGYHIVATRFSFAQLNLTFAHVLDRVIVNQTGLDGDFDFTLDLNVDEAQPNPLDPPLLINAIRDQLGLNVKQQRSPVDFLVIDSVEKPAVN